MLENLNKELFLLINHFAGQNTIIDKLSIVVAEYLPIVFILLLLYLWFKTDKFKKEVLYSGYSALFWLFLNFIISQLYFHPRPFMDKIWNNIFFHIPETSFPSDHTTFMLAIAIQLLFFAKTRIIWTVLILLALIWGSSRVFIGIHYPFDILGSILTALLSATIIYNFWEKLSLLNNFIYEVDKNICTKFKKIKESF